MIRFIEFVALLLRAGGVFFKYFNGLSGGFWGDELGGDADALKVHAVDGKFAGSVAELIRGEGWEVDARFDWGEAKGVGALARKWLEGFGEKGGVDLEMVFDAELEIPVKGDGLPVGLEG